MKRKRRTPSEFARVYGSKERVAWVAEQPCTLCYNGPSDNAHLPTRSGMGRKGPYTAIIPLCHDCHGWFDRQSAAWRRTFAPNAANLEEAWQAHQQGTV